jgi:hypothetical protein
MMKLINSSSESTKFSSHKTVNTLQIHQDFKRYNKHPGNPNKFRVFSNFLKTKVFSNTPLYTPVSFNHIVQILNKDMALGKFLQKNPADFVSFHQWLNNFLYSKKFPYLLNTSSNFELVEIPFDPNSSTLSNSSSPISDPPVSPISTDQEFPLTDEIIVETNNNHHLLNEAKIADECGLLSDLFLRLGNDERLFLLRNYFQHDLTKLTIDIETNFKVLYTENPLAVLPDYLFENDFVFLTFLNQYCLIPQSLQSPQSLQ